MKRVELRHSSKFAGYSLYKQQEYCKKNKRFIAGFNEQRGMLKPSRFHAVVKNYGVAPTFIIG